ncbi:trypsin-like peptidase domain-containing protein [Nonomuraea endophytica]|uniref:trypsin-like peptidase domain-containing protein n=1 Tax=Nonomuraea endophytica TaxID=714136 RepID=UPI0037C63865
MTKKLPALGAMLIVFATALGCAQNADNLPKPAPVDGNARVTPRAPAQVAVSRSNVVKLIGNAPPCDSAWPEGTGFAYEPERVMTTAHLMAGTSGPITVIRPEGKHYKGRVVLFDPGRDVAVLRVPGLRTRSLVFGPIKPGENATFAGFPRGGDLAVASGSVGRSITVRGPDIHRKRQVRREVLIVDAAVKPGIAGSPLFRSDGTVSGMIFASDVGEPRGYALTAAEITRPAMDGQTATADVSTQGCSV